MIYSNDDPMALMAMEMARTGNYGADYYDDDDEEYAPCPICGEPYPDHYYLNELDECIGCSECVRKVDTL